MKSTKALLSPVGLNLSTLTIPSTQLNRYWNTGLPSRSRDRTGLTMLLDLFLVRFSLFFCLSRVVDVGGYTSAFYCTLNAQYCILSYRIVSYRINSVMGIEQQLKGRIMSDDQASEN